MPMTLRRWPRPAVLVECRHAGARHPAASASPTGTRSSARSASRSLPLANSDARLHQVGFGRRRQRQRRRRRDEGAPARRSSPAPGTSPPVRSAPPAQRRSPPTSTIAAAVIHHMRHACRGADSTSADAGFRAARVRRADGVAGVRRPRARIEAIDAAEHAQRHVVRRALIERVAQQRAGARPLRPCRTPRGPRARALRRCAAARPARCARDRCRRAPDRGCDRGTARASRG